VEQGLLERTVEKENDQENAQEQYVDTGNRALVQEFSRQISRFLRSSHFALH
jgi:hypothetical protein